VATLAADRQIVAVRAGKVNARRGQVHIGLGFSEGAWHGSVARPGRIAAPASVGGGIPPRYRQEGPSPMGQRHRRRLNWDRVERVVRLLIAIANEVAKLSDTFHRFH